MKKNILTKILTHSKKTKTILSTRKYGPDNSQFVGYIVDFNETVFIMQQVSTLGLEDGLLVEAFDNVETFEMDEYEKSYQYLFENADIIKKQTITKLPLPNGENWKFDLLKSLSAEKKIITIQLSCDKNIVCGYIVEFDETYLQLNAISTIGEDQGNVIYKLADISTFTIDELESRKRKAFNEWRLKAR